MPVLLKHQAAEKLATFVEKIEPVILAEIYSELFPEEVAPPQPSATDLAKYIRGGLAAEEIVDLWNVVFPSDRNIWYDEQEDEIHFNEEVAGYSD